MVSRHPGSLPPSSGNAHHYLQVSGQQQQLNWHPRRHDIDCLDAHRNIKIHRMTISKVGWKISSGWSLFSPKMHSSHRTSGREHYKGWDTGHSDRECEVGSDHTHKRWSLCWSNREWHVQGPFRNGGIPNQYRRFH